MDSKQEKENVLKSALVHVKRAAHTHTQGHAAIEGSLSKKKAFSAWKIKYMCRVFCRAGEKKCHQNQKLLLTIFFFTQYIINHNMYVIIFEKISKHV